MSFRYVFWLAVMATSACLGQEQEGIAQATRTELYFPPPGESLDIQERRAPADEGMTAEFIEGLKPLVAGRWALWRYGYLVHVEGDFNAKGDVASLRKTWHALTVGAAIKQNKIPGVSQKISVWSPELSGIHAEATWWHVITQTSGFDYPYGDWPAQRPGAIWTYSDKNPRVLCNALARVYGKKDFRDDYADVVSQAYFDAIGLRGWRAVPQQDGIRFHFDLEDMGRLGLLVLNRGRWKDKEVIPQWFVEQLERKQTYGIGVNYDGPDDGKISLDPQRFPEAPYGFMTWVNTDGDFYPGADRAWAWAAGAGGTRVLWNRKNGIVFAAFGADKSPSDNGIPHVIERSILHKHGPAADTGPFAKWSKIELTFHGPISQGQGKPSPFAVGLDVDFCSPTGKHYRVPGFYDGDGRGGLDGNVWKVRFSADETGSWKFTTISDEERLYGKAGEFVVTDVPAEAEGFWKLGRLESVGTADNSIRYLKFRDGPYWLKAGCDDPENFLGKSKNYDTLPKREVAVDYLTEHGINSLYMMTHNIDGDDKDVWPWLGNTTREAKANSSGDVRFDVARLEEWRELFEYMQTRSVVTYLVLEDDSAWKGYDHARYYREMIARFGYLPGLIFNFNEEANENYTLQQALEYMRQLAELDPYGHPRGIHNVNTPSDDYIDAPQIDFTSIQIGSPGGRELDVTSPNRRAIDWIERCRSRRRRVLMVGFDEGRPEEDRRTWWSAYLGGAVWESHVLPPYDRPVVAWQRVWTELGGTRAFMETLPFWEMEPANDVVRSGEAFCLAKRGEVYALYLPVGGEVRVELPRDREFQLAWWNPSQGRSGKFAHETRVGGGVQTLSPPGEGDWTARIVSISARTPAGRRENESGRQR